MSTPESPPEVLDTRGSGSLRSTLTRTIAAVAIIVVLLTGLGTLVLSRLDARRGAADDLGRQVGAFAVLLAPQRDAGPLETSLRPRLREAFQLSDIATVAVSASGAVVGTLPDGVPGDALDAVDLDTDRTVSGVSGTTVWAAAALGPLDRVGRRSNLVGVVVATRTVPGGLGSAGGWLLLSGGVSVVVAVLVARRAAGRLSAGVTAAASATARIADGDLTARVPEVGTGEVADLARQVNAMATDLERRDELERQFLLSVSHDLRTPLTSIRGYAEALADGAVEPSTVAETLLSESSRLERLIGDLLEVARLDAHRFDLHPADADIGAAVRRGVEALQPVATEAGVHLEVTAPDGAHAVVDVDRFGQVVANLVENAVTFARSRVMVSVTQTSDGIRIDVDDDGPGISPDDRDRVFDRMYSARGDRRRSVGTGLGLTIARELVTAMGGRISVGDAELGGARLTVVLEASPGDAGP